MTMILSGTEQDGTEVWTPERTSAALEEKAAYERKAQSDLDALFAASQKILTDGK